MPRRTQGDGLDARTALEQFHDYLAPKLDVYEQAVYLYILRHSRLVGKPELTVELKSAAGRIAGGGRAMAARTCLRKLQSLDAKGCIKLVARDEEAPDVRVFLPSEIPGLIEDRGPGQPDIESLDFFDVTAHRRLIQEREGGRCFYCRKKINETSVAFDHVSPRPPGNNSYRNVVAACRRCNNRKGDSAGEDLLRVLYREGAVTSDLLADRLSALQELREGKLRP